MTGPVIPRRPRRRPMRCDVGQSGRQSVEGVANRGVGRSLRRGIGWVTACLALLGCSRTTDRTWTYSVDPTIGVMGIRAEIRRGGCNPPLGEQAYAAQIRVGSESGSVVPDLLDSGSYSFFVTALNSDCDVVARGCETFDLPDAPVVHVPLTLAARPVTGCTAGELCMAGVCRGREIDGGMPARATLAHATTLLCSISAWSRGHAR